VTEPLTPRCAGEASLSLGGRDYSRTSVFTRPPNRDSSSTSLSTGLTDTPPPRIRYWKGPHTMKVSYQQADPDTMLRVVLEGGELRKA
jgi:hypothetical protein